MSLGPYNINSASLARVIRMMIIKILHSSDERFVITFNID